MIGRWTNTSLLRPATTIAISASSVRLACARSRVARSTQPIHRSAWCESHKTSGRTAWCRRSAKMISGRRCCRSSTTLPNTSASNLSFELARDQQGRVACDVVWQLPAHALPGSGDPTACSDYPFLSNVSGGRKVENDRGGKNCGRSPSASPSNGDGFNTVRWGNLRAEASPTSRDTDPRRA